MPGAILAPGSPRGAGVTGRRIRVGRARWPAARVVSRLEALRTEKSNRSRMSAIWGTAKVRGDTAEQAFLAESVEEVL
jgi:hypothetical protein